jgi:flavin-dependent dehydrogenase
MLYPEGYGGIQPVKGALQISVAWCNSFLAKMRQDCPHLAMRLAGAEPLLAKPIAITHIPHGYIRRTAEDGLYCIGDQAAIIPSFTGDGISIAAYCTLCHRCLSCSRVGTALRG